MGGVGRLGELERHDGPRASAFSWGLTKTTSPSGKGAWIADHKMFMFGSVALRHEEE
jgi:hypothetical protein